MKDILLMATAIAMATSGAVEAIKYTKWVDGRYLPLLAIFVGALLGAAATFIDIGLVERLWAGGISGLAATGLYEGIKNTVKDDE